MLQQQIRDNDRSNKLITNSQASMRDNVQEKKMEIMVQRFKAIADDNEKTAQQSRKNELAAAERLVNTAAENDMLINENYTLKT